MIGPGPNVRIYLACGATDMRKGIGGLAALVESVPRQKPTSGAVFSIRRGGALRHTSQLRAPPRLSLCRGDQNTMCQVKS